MSPEIPVTLGRVSIRGHTHLAVLLEGSAILLSEMIPGIGDDMISLISNWEEFGPRIHTLAAQAKDPEPIRLSNLRRPIDRPGKILAIGLNYADHVAETGMRMPESQLWFCKFPTAANDPYADVQIPRAGHQVDYEVELVAVIGKSGRHISPDDASQHVFGYCVGNDVSVRDWQLSSPQWVLGKSFDSHAPFGPYITLAHSALDPHDLTIRAWVNGQLRQHSNTRHLVFSLWEQIAHISKAVTLEPGDLIFTGTPGGVGVGLQPPKFLKAGDRVRCEIEGLGHIENTFQPEGSDHGS